MIISDIDKAVNLLRSNIVEEWALFCKVKWPKLPPSMSELDSPACDLMEQDTFVAGCIQRIADTGELPERFHHYLIVNDNLTKRLMNATDIRKVEFLVYKFQLDKLINMASLFVNLQRESTKKDA